VSKDFTAAVSCKSIPRASPQGPVYDSAEMTSVSQYNVQTPVQIQWRAVNAFSLFLVFACVLSCRKQRHGLRLGDLPRCPCLMLPLTAPRTCVMLC